MIIQVASPLLADSHCRQVSCRFDKYLFREETAGQLGIVLPSTLNGAVQKRKAEFIAGRYCARTAISQLGGNVDLTIGVGAHREPLWPQGFVGSITHTEGYASAMIAHRNKIRAVGLDSETWIKPQRAHNLGKQILTPSESLAGHMHLFESQLHYLTLVFSAKESLFKCLFPLVHSFFDFQAATITPTTSMSTTDGEFHFELLEDLNAEFHAGYCGHGSYSITAAGVHTSVVLKARVEPT